MKRNPEKSQENKYKQNTKCKLKTNPNTITKKHIKKTNKETSQGWKNKTREYLIFQWERGRRKVAQNTEQPNPLIFSATVHARR